MYTFLDQALDFKDSIDTSDDGGNNDDDSYESIDFVLKQKDKDGNDDKDDGKGDGNVDLGLGGDCFV